MPSSKPARNHLHSALKAVRNARGLTQEDFALVSSRTYVSSVERGVRNPTLSKIDELASVLKVHPLTVVTLAYCHAGKDDGGAELLDQVASELGSLFPSRRSSVSDR